MRTELSDTQKLIHPMLNAGKSDKEIALALNVTRGYIGMQISRMRKKLGALDRARPFLTDAEREVAHGLAKGHSYARVALDLGVQPGTIRALAYKIYKKYGAHSKQDLAYKMKQIEDSKTG